MRVLIVTDLEGISCVDSIDMIFQQVPYRKACEYLMADVNAAVDGAFLAGATQVTVLDGHGGGDNFIPSLLDPRADQMPAAHYVHNPVEGYDALMCVGAHAMAGTENAFLDHTQSSQTWFDYCINGKPQGEIAQEAYFMGAYGTPLVMVSGDAAACREAENLVPGVATACVKEAKGRNAAQCLPLSETVERIRQAAKAGVERCREIKPLTLAMPTELSLTLCRNDYCDSAMHPGLRRSGRTIYKTIENITTYADLVIF